MNESRSSHPFMLHYAMLMETRIPDDAFKELKNLNLGKRMHTDLVGVLEDQLSLDCTKCPKFNKFVTDMAYEFVYMRQESGFLSQLLKTFITESEGRPVVPEKLMKLKLKQLWLNSMGKGNYQPLHNHAGLFSFVVYLNIPYTLDEEHKLNNGIESSKNKNGCTEFVDPFTHNNIIIPVENKMEQHIAIFPSWVTHLVYPFKSDVRRITVSGNIYVDKLL
tara:strand:+ start:719 stop:1378 length:660 start_codon:yes stop_codon:yes gene_type:complete